MYEDSESLQGRVSDVSGLVKAEACIRMYVYINVYIHGTCTYINKVV